ncbi:MAG: (deoxy)nucleoside triphosphate pyrophosphohydrolase [Bdellovibrionaceae bacterium]|nr:(deoxy)nucleoside triphosphate pyrophosphohydrolase [Pseudobdellovibrionaceae bacterium]
MKNKIDVVAAIISNDSKEILFAQKPPQDNYLPNFWEFPGGKIKNEETPKDALIREVKEELDLDIQVVKHFKSVLHEYPFARVHLHSYLCFSEKAQAVAFEHQKILWLKKEKAQILNFAPADIPIFQKLLLTNWP